MQFWLYDQGDPMVLDPRYTLYGPGASVQLSVVVPPLCDRRRLLLISVGAGFWGPEWQVPPPQAPPVLQGVPSPPGAVLFSLPAPGPGGRPSSVSPGVSARLGR